MKKFLLTLAVIIAMASTCFAANSTDVCDFESKVFIKNYNQVLKVRNYQKSIAINKKFVTSQINQEGIETIIMPLKNFNDGEGIVIALVIDQQGYIWEVNLHNDSLILYDDLAAAFEVALYTIGLEQDEIYEIEQELVEKGSVEKYIPIIDRYLTINDDAFKNGGIGSVEISAYVD
jgi:hypothetical protein